MTIDPIVEDNYWQHVCDAWSRPCLDAGSVAAELAIPRDVVEHRFDVIGLPAPQKVGSANLWTRQHVYSYILLHQPHRESRIPRLFPFTSLLHSARFLHGQVIDDVAVHGWQPTDGRGPVAIAYPTGQSSQDLPNVAEGLLQRLPWATAVVVPSYETCSAPDQSEDERPQRQPYVWVAEHHRPVSSHAWLDVAYLLRVDLPWWSMLLRDRAAMASWQPGCPQQRLRARDAGLDPRVLLGLVTATTPEYVSTLVHRFVQHLDQQVGLFYADNDGHDELSARRGLIHAAVADADPRSRIEPPTASEQALLLHQPCPTNLVAEAALNVWSKWSALRGSYKIPVDTPNELAREWLARLVPAQNPNELGYSMLRLMYARPLSGHTVALRDPYDPHSWAIASGDTVYAGVAARVPATGNLIEARVESWGGFFRDSAGHVWPLPLSGRGGYSCGGPGAMAGKRRLVIAITNLRVEAGRDVDAFVAADAGSPLAFKVAKTAAPPLVLAPGDPALVIAGEGQRFPLA